MLLFIVLEPVLKRIPLLRVLFTVTPGKRKKQFEERIAALESNNGQIIVYDFDKHKKE